MGAIIQDLKNFGQRFSSNGKRIILPDTFRKADTFTASVAVCAFRDVKIGAWKTLWALQGCPNPKITPIIQEGDALISRSRNKVATHFLKNTDCEMLCFLDDDIEISTLDFTMMMWEAHVNKYPILGAPYALKNPDKGGFAFMALEDKGQVVMGKAGGIVPVRRVSTGCMIIRREVFEKMIEKETAHLCKQGYYGFFQHREILIDEVWDDASEDWWFCKVASDLGFGVFMDTRPKTKHWGLFPYSWDSVSMGDMIKNGKAMDAKGNAILAKNESMVFNYDVKK